MFDTTLFILLGLAALGFISHNTTVAISILVLIIVRVTPLNVFFPWIEKQGLTIGIIILTIGVMAPLPAARCRRRRCCTRSLTGSRCWRLRWAYSSHGWAVAAWR